MQQKQKLELTWIEKDKRPRLEPRVLVEDVAKSHHAATRRRDGKDIFNNMLIHGDSLLALKSAKSADFRCILNGGRDWTWTSDLYRVGDNLGSLFLQKLALASVQGGWIML